jgi:serine protease AprX
VWINVAFGISWKDSKKAPGLMVGLLLLLALLPGALIQSPDAAASMADAASRLVSVIVRENPGSSSRPETLVEDAGGKVGRHIDIIDGFVADVPKRSLESLESDPSIHSVTRNVRVKFMGAGGRSRAPYDPAGLERYMPHAAIGAAAYYRHGLTGKGVGIALIDTGTVPVEGLDAPDKVIHGPDLSFESQAPNLAHLDSYGHGTHMAGILAGNDGHFDRSSRKLPFWGIAPDAHVVSLKVGDAHGTTDVSQVIAAIDWIVQHRNDPGLNIKVLNLSFGTDGTQDYRIDPLAYAAEVAWRKGIVVVVAAGNAGYGSRELNNPAYDPFVISVGGTDTLGTFNTRDDVVGSFSSRGNADRSPDVVAPGKSVVSLRAAGSYVDLTYPNGRVSDRFFKGTGTSQAAAVVSGAAALIAQQRPGITPDQVKALLKSSATVLPNADHLSQGAGLIDLADAYDDRTPSARRATQTWAPSTGVGSLELARGSTHVFDGDVGLTGEQDIFGARWDGTRWAYESLNEISWTGGSWNGNTWTGNTWSGNTWSGNTWTGNTWSGNTWTGNTWSGNTWSGNTWSGNTWSGNTWSSGSWGD